MLKKDGALLAYAGFDSKDARVTAAIACNVWASFEKNTQPTDDPLNLVCMECEVRPCDIYVITSHAAPKRFRKWYDICRVCLIGAGAPVHIK